MEKKVFRTWFLSTYAAIFAVYIAVGFLPAASANSYDISGELKIPSISLDSSITDVAPISGELTSPDNIPGIYQPNDSKTLIIGHSSTIFKNLAAVPENSIITLKTNDEPKTYKVIKTEILPKSEISMKKILAPTDKKTLIIMTCAGAPYPDNDASHRLIITAKESPN